MRRASYKHPEPRVHDRIPSPSIMIPSPNSEPYLFPLPQYGFGADIDFKTLLPNNPFLYRVYTPKERSPFFDESDPFFVAPKFDEVYARTPVEVTSATIIDPLDSSYSDVATHMEWTTRSQSIFLSTSFSFAWSIWEAVRRYHHGMKKDVEIAVIDASAVMGRAATAVELLKNGSDEERTSQHTKWYRFSQESQSVLIYGFIPGNAVLASVPLLSVLERLPPYYLRSKTQPSPGRPLDHLGWNFADKKHNYRQFCQEITNRFFGQSQEIRFRDATGGSMRLALTLLRPWFHRTITQDFKHATNTLRALAIIVANFGGQWWAKEHSELNRILDTMANTLGEELLQRFKRDDQAELHRLQDTVDTLEKVIRRHETKRLTRPRRASSAAKECCSTPITPESSPRVRPRRTLSMSMTLPLPTRETANVQTPITPPESPSFSQIFSRNVDLEYLPSTITFQPFTPPVEWPSLPMTTPPLSRSGSTRSIGLATTPPALRSILSPVEEVLSPTEDVTPAVPQAEGQHTAPQTPTTPQKELKFEAPQTPMFTPRKTQYLPSPATTPPAVLDSLTRDGFRARTLSDLAPGGLRIEIPAAVPRQLVFPPSPVESIGDQSLRTCAESPESSPGTLAPSPIPPHAGIADGESKTPLGKKLPLQLDSPVVLSSTKEKLDELPPLPPSPALSWGSASTLSLDSRAASPAPIGVRDSFASDTTRVAPGSPVSMKRSRSTSSLSSVQSRRSVLDLLPPRPAVEDESKEKGKVVEVAPSSPVSPQTPLSDYLVTPVETSPKRGVFPYRVPRPPVGIFNTPLEVDAGVRAYEHTDLNTELRKRGRRAGKPKLVETGAFIVTGFLVGAFATLFLVSTQRRTLLSLT